MPWQYPDDALISLCADCHHKEHERCKPRQFKDLESVRKREAKGISVDGVPKAPAKPKKEKKKKVYENVPPQVGPRNPVKEKNLPRRYRIRKQQVCYTCGKVIKKRAWAIHHWWVKPTSNAYDHLHCYKGQYTEPTKQPKKPK